MSFRRTWLRFLRAGRTLGPTPGVREAWARGGEAYHAWVLEVDDPRVRARRDAVRALLEEARPGCTAPWCEAQPHVTAWVAGWTLPPVHALEGERVALEVRGASAFASCPFLEVASPALRRLRATFPGAEERWAPYHPHVTVALWARTEPVAPLARALRAVRALPPLHVEGALRLAAIDPRDAAGSYAVRVIPRP
jgi:hypothetical protein